MIGLILVISIFTMSDDKQMVIIVIVVNLFIIVTISSLDGLDQLHWLLEPVVRFPVDCSEGRVYRESHWLVVCCYLQRLSLILQRLAVSLIEGDVPFVVVVLQGEVVVVIVVEISEGF